MQEYKWAIEEEEETAKIDADVLENWELLVKKGGNTRRYGDAFLKDKCLFAVVDAIADFGLQHGINGQALTDYVIGALHERINRSDIPWRMTRWWTGWTEWINVRMKMGIVVRMVIVTFLTSERMFLFGS